MKKTLFCLALLTSGSVIAATDHYIKRDGNHVHHLKITRMGNEINVMMDVDFEPNPNEQGKACNAQISGEAKTVGDNKIQLKKHSEGEANYCVLDITTSDSGAKVEQSKDCDNFVTGLCHFSSDGEEIPRIK